MISISNRNSRQFVFVRTTETEHRSPRQSLIGQLTEEQRIKIDGYPWQAHRLMIGLYRGEMVHWDDHVHHLCEVKGCVNPGHLQVLSAAEHNRRHRQPIGRAS